MIRKKKIIETIILVVFAAVLGSFCNQRMPIPDTEENNISSANFNILSAMKNGLLNEELLEYYQEDIKIVDEMGYQIIIDYYDVDLNGDNQMDKIVHLAGSAYHSGSHGDILNILIKEGNAYRVVLMGTYRLFSQENNEPLGELYILESKSNGFADIKMYSDGAEIILRYEEGIYQLNETENQYFFETGTEWVNCQIAYTLNNHFSGNVDLGITKIRELEYGKVYELKIECGEILGEEDYYAYERFHLGYFYVTPTQIYRTNDEELATTGTERDLMSVGTIVCAMWESEDNPAEKGWHEYITLEENRCVFHSYNNSAETGFYESFTWEAGKGLVEYRSGYGAERDCIWLQRTEVIEEENLEEQYYGKWKVISYIPLTRTTAQQTRWQKEHYFGRTIEITEEAYIESIHYWPEEIDEHSFFYDYCEVSDMKYDDSWITRNAESFRWLDGEYFENDTIRMLKFYPEESDAFMDYCAVTSDNEHLINSWLSGDYLLERFDTQDASVEVEDIYGEWTITRLDSYNNAYHGREEDAEWIPEEWTEHLHFSDFYAPEWFGKKVVITEESLDVAAEITGKINTIQEVSRNKQHFEEIWGIHDELSLTNEEIIIYEIGYGEEGEWIRIVPFHQDKMAIHIGLGWFIMEKDVEENEMMTRLNQPFFYGGFAKETDESLFELTGEFGESVRGEFEVELEGNGEIPEGLIAKIEEALYGSVDYKSEVWLEYAPKSEDTPYYQMLRELGADEFCMDLEEIYEKFPELQVASVAFEDEYEAFQYLKGERCYNIFHLSGEGRTDRYVALVDTGGSAGGVDVYVCEWNGEQLVPLYDACVRNPLCSSVICYEGDYYYLFLNGNYGLKVLDGVQIFKLGEEAFEGNLMIKYVAEEFVWENVYCKESVYTDGLDAYIESMKETITSGEWLEGGQDKDIIGMMQGDEWETYEFPLAEEHNPCYGVDFANTGTYVYLEKHNHWPSNTTSSWHLYADFYLWDESTDCITELEELAVNVNQSVDVKIVQLWFKKIEDKVFAFRISHVSSYNYVLDVLLIEGDEVTHMRRNLISPKRGFILYEGIDNFGEG